MVKDLVKTSLRGLGEEQPVPGPAVMPAPGVKIVKLNSNENRYGMSAKAKAAMKAVVDGENYYPDPVGTSLKEKLAAYHGIKPSNIVVGNGSSTILEAIGNVFVCPGDEVITCVPTFMVYLMIVSQNGGKPVCLPLTEEKRFDLQAIRNAVTDKTKMILICNPNNPTGTVVDSEELEEFILSMPDHIITVIDEAYIDFAEEGKCCSMIPLINRKNLIITRTFSKIYGLAGARVGYAVANEEICRFLGGRIMIFNINKAAIVGAEEALADREFYEMCRRGHQEGRVYLTEEFRKLGFTVYDSQSSFLYMEAPEGFPAAEINEKLREKGFLINMSPESIRISVGTMEDNRGLVACLKELMGQ